ncbi:hypothetical protein Pflav_067220 [Phytohabitans flavus]|uniref:Uncharacterized protein n=1 Tax=Phytohabitans flavus TaxID=1076124 RepID=A0A6F8Y2G6_9ACTN|nr:hypothetical protein Pflav_067220 [Phytohabitans flavus]
MRAGGHNWRAWREWTIAGNYADPGQTPTGRTDVRRSMTLLACAAMATALLASGCSAGQDAETAEMVPAVPGANDDVPSSGGALSVRNAMVVYHAGGYEAGADAPLDLSIFNGMDQPVTVTVTSPDARSVTLVTGAKGTPSPSASPSPTATATPRPPRPRQPPLRARRPRRPPVRRRRPRSRPRPPRRPPRRRPSGSTLAALRRSRRPARSSSSFSASTKS